MEWFQFEIPNCLLDVRYLFGSFWKCKLIREWFQFGIPHWWLVGRDLFDLIWKFVTHASTKKYIFLVLLSLILYCLANGTGRICISKWNWVHVITIFLTHSANYLFMININVGIKKLVILGNNLALSAFDTTRQSSSALQTNFLFTKNSGHLNQKKLIS